MTEALEVTGRGWVIELDGVIAAFAIGNALTGSIFALFVDPAHQGQGYGRRCTMPSSSGYGREGSIASGSTRNQAPELNTFTKSSAGDVADL